MVNLSPARTAQDYTPIRELKVGDRVMRQKTAGNAKLGFLHGEITKVRPRFGATPLYDIRWDSDTTQIDTGYLQNGLQSETFDS